MCKLEIVSATFMSSSYHIPYLSRIGPRVVLFNCKRKSSVQIHTQHPKSENIHVKNSNTQRLVISTFQSLVYRLVNNVETFKEYGKLPDQEDWQEFANFIEVKNPACNF